ncbi:hypothetical protein OIDMADRAFT_99439 [Oidiodendron maius Zn]|uniref:NAD-dependent epimerase/dehydratase domain-containing protein n=1 Tax=Oidiodendron maius (strain Zn) TaxID=913774 RepID=A0A0C3HY98_OIDMZ|nr:hypothetical protein OIDMADRAFT_99439 [Oidiodendron maius Zn]
MPETILVTGASGYVASHVIRQFLEAGYKVRGTVRNEASAEKVRHAHAQYADNLSFSYVKDMSVPGAFNEAVQGIDGIIHTASPFILDAKDYEKELFTPAVNGTLFILQAAKAHAPGVRRIVITSSFASVLDVTKGLRPGYVYTETNWNPMTVEETHAAGPSPAYLVSKTLAEKAAFDFVEKEKPGFSIATVTPPMVYGPLLETYDSMEKLNTSSMDIYRLFNGSLKEVPDTAFWAYIDVRDLARAHYLAYTTPAAANQRYLTAARNFSYQILCDMIRAKYPELVATTPEGRANQPLPDVYRLDTSKAKKELGLEYRSLEETLFDAVDTFLTM